MIERGPVKRGQGGPHFGHSSILDVLTFRRSDFGRAVNAMK